MRKRSGYSALRLRSILGLFALGILALPFAMFSLARLAFASSYDSTNPLPRSIAVSIVVQSVVEVPPGGSLRATRAPSIPPWLELAVVDASGTVVLSTFPGFEAGERIDPAGLYLQGGNVKPGWRFITEALSEDGAIAGYFMARFPSDPLGLSANPGLPYALALFPLALALAAFSFGSILAAKMARSFESLSAAAARIARGDLDGPIKAKGAREVVALADTMDAMRAALKEDRSQGARFLAGISHDLRTPLTSLRGYLEALEDGVAADDAERERWFRIMKDKTSVLEDRITEILSFARMQTGEWKLRMAPLEIEPFLRGLCGLFASDAGSVGKSFGYDLGGTEGLSIMADSKLLVRAMENLFGNALRYAPSGAGISLSCSVEGGGIRIFMDDRGPGIAAEELSRVFEPYYRGSSASGEGEGLGLSIARSILRDHGGDIVAENLPGGGCRFSASLPLATIPGADPAP